ncbi:MAG: zf-HC2 domain-containing protein, partial [Deltaproteobacteria bacterium]|nr:zf-HC2 domain-containing protein [Deltaproteobacteria bacterium]
MDKDLAQIVGLIRHHLHLTGEEIEGYLEGKLDRDQREMVDEHLRRCPYCASELAFVREALADQSPRGVLEDILEAAR